MELVGALSNHEIHDQLRRLSEKLDQIAADWRPCAHSYEMMLDKRQTFMWHKAIRHTTMCKTF